MDPELRTLFTALIEGQTRTDASIRELTATVAGYVESGDELKKIRTD